MEAFEPQTRALGHLREVVLAMLGRCGDEGRKRSGSIVLRKRVFTKVRVENSQCDQTVTLSVDSARCQRRSSVRDQGS